MNNMYSVRVRHNYRTALTSNGKTVGSRNNQHSFRRVWCQSHSVNTLGNLFRLKKTPARYSSAVRILRVSTRQTTHVAWKTVDLLTGETADFILLYALAAKQPRLESGGLQSVVSNAAEGLQRAHHIPDQKSRNQGRSSIIQVGTN